MRLMAKVQTEANSKIGYGFMSPDSPSHSHHFTFFRRTTGIRTAEVHTLCDQILLLTKSEQLATKFRKCTASTDSNVGL